MTALAEKLKAAGADTIGAQFTAACTQAARLHPHDIEAAWRSVGVSFGHAFIRGILADMNLPSRPDGETGRLSTAAIEWKPGICDPAAALVKFDRSPLIKLYQPRAITPERIERRQELKQIVRSKFKTSDNVAWSDVTWHSLQSMKRDGTEAVALLGAAPHVIPNDGRTVGDVLGVKKVDEIIAAIRQ